MSGPHPAFPLYDDCSDSHGRGRIASLECRLSRIEGNQTVIIILMFTCLAAIVVLAMALSLGVGWAA